MLSIQSTAVKCSFVILCAEQMQNMHFARTRYYPIRFACLTCNRSLIQDMWRLEDKVEGSERYTPSGGSERTREKLFGLDGVSARDDDDDHDHDHDHEEDEKGEITLSAMPRK